MTAAPIPGRSLVTKRAVRELVRNAVLSVYGVSGFAGGGRLGLLLDRAGFGNPGCRVALEPALAVDLDLLVAFGLPVAEVARQVESAVSYTLRHAIGREPEHMTIKIGRLRREHGIAPLRDAGTSASSEPSPADLAASGTDVA
ncbi:MAG: Asp23/Gls24 family envelope stress response protein [Chloroflexota bacterium]